MGPPAAGLAAALAPELAAGLAEAEAAAAALAGLAAALVAAALEEAGAADGAAAPPQPATASMAPSIVPSSRREDFIMASQYTAAQRPAGFYASTSSTSM